MAGDRVAAAESEWTSASVQESRADGGPCVLVSDLLLVLQGHILPSLSRQHCPCRRQPEKHSRFAELGERWLFAQRAEGAPHASGGRSPAFPELGGP